MALSIGIVGLPNVGKSTLFNALTKAQNAQAANYPFCTIEPNKATVPVPDSRIDTLVELVHPQKTIYATVDFIDIAGLVRGASKGEGLGNQFLGNIRECAAVLEVVRCFEDDDITHVDGSVDPLRDIEPSKWNSARGHSGREQALRAHGEDVQGRQGRPRGFRRDGPPAGAPEQRQPCLRLRGQGVPGLRRRVA